MISRTLLGRFLRGFLPIFMSCTFFDILNKTFFHLYSNSIQFDL